MGTGRLFWQAAGRSVEDGEVWCRFQQDDQGGGDHVDCGGDHGHGGGDHGDGGGDHGHGGGDHGHGAELCAGFNEQASAGLGQEESMGAKHAVAGSKVVFKSFRSCKETQKDCFRSHLM